MGVCVFKESAELKDTLAAVGHQGKELYNMYHVGHFIGRCCDRVPINFLVIYMFTSQYSFWRDRPYYRNDTSNQSVQSCGCWVSVCTFLSLSLAQSLSTLPPFVFISVSALLPLSVYFVCGVGALYLFYRRQIPGVCIFSQHADCCLKSSQLLVFVFVIFMINFLATAAGVWLHCC